MKSIDIDNPLIILLMGPPGSGKGTQAAFLSAAYNIPHVSTGDIFRDHIKRETPLGLKVKAITQSGGYVSDELTIELVEERLSRQDCVRGYILDGFPRTMNQAQKFLDFVHSETPILVFALDVSDDVIINRASSRVVCKNCGAIYQYNPTIDLSHCFCQKCNGELYRRPDDQSEVVASRLKIYRDLTEPLLNFFKEKNLLTSFEGNMSKEDVSKGLTDKINSLFKDKLN